MCCHTSFCFVCSPSVQRRDVKRCSAIARQSGTAKNLFLLLLIRFDCRQELGRLAFKLAELELAQNVTARSEPGLDFLQSYLFDLFSGAKFVQLFRRCAFVQCVIGEQTALPVGEYFQLLSLSKHFAYYARCLAQNSFPLVVDEASRLPDAYRPSDRSVMPRWPDTQKS
jgi:hypothetical protein